MSLHDCQQKENIGKFKEFMNNFKGMKTMMGGVIVAILVQVGTFLYLWGSLTNTVNKNTNYLWGDITSSVKENTRTLDRLLAKFETIQVIGVPNKTN
jgi:hypothetical protein